MTNFEASRTWRHRVAVVAACALVMTAVAAANPARSLADPTYTEVTGGQTHSWSNYTNAGGTAGPVFSGQTSVGIDCVEQNGFRVSDGNTNWYHLAGTGFYASADAFYNNGASSGSLLGTPYVDPAVPSCESSSNGSQPASPEPPSTQPLPPSTLTAVVIPAQDPANCYLVVNHPHNSHHVNGRINAIIRFQCSSPAPSTGIVAKLFKQGHFHFYHQVAYTYKLSPDGAKSYNVSVSTPCESGSYYATGHVDTVEDGQVFGQTATSARVKITC